MRLKVSGGNGGYYLGFVALWAIPTSAVAQESRPPPSAFCRSAAPAPDEVDTKEIWRSGAPEMQRVAAR
jgi:hypothetical protein